MRKYQKKLLDDGTPNPRYKKDTRSQKGRSKSIDRSKYDKGRKRSGETKSNFEKGNFICLDGEGGEVDGVHRYLMCMASDGDEAESIFKEGGLSTDDCLHFLMRQKQKHHDGIFVIFAGGYDGNLWLRDVPRETIEKIVKADFNEIVWWKGWGIRFKQRKYFALCNDKIRDKNGKLISMVIWDVHGFFQSSFVVACNNWIPDYEKLDLIIEGKKQRTAFTADQREFMSEYTYAELQALKLIMTKLRDACETLGLTLNRWDGAGAIAAAIYKNHNVKQHYAPIPDHIHEASKHAYFGGRIEIAKIGHHEGTIYHYDINSAYPSKQYLLPSLAGGEWKRSYETDVRKIPEQIVICLVRWDINEEEILCPFPYRSQLQNLVLYPHEGYGWYWKPEVEAALNARDSCKNYYKIEIEETYVFYPATDEKPFYWIHEYYEERKRIVAESKRTGIPNGVEKAIKLGINSLYGKLAQRVGYNPQNGRIPPYHNLVYAGYITSATRAQLFTAGQQKPHAIICLATDGIYSTEPLELDCPKDKILGAWEANEHDAMTLVQSGVYFLREGDKWFSYSRGFDKMTTQQGMRETWEIIMNAWKKKETHISLPCTRFITLKSALIGGDWWDRWLTWHEFIQPDGTKGRRLGVTCMTGKRDYRDKKVFRPDLRITQTYPTVNLFPDILSAPHDIPWDDSEGFANETELIQEYVIESRD